MPGPKSFSSARGEARRGARRSAFAGVAWSALGLASCGLDLKGELAETSDAGDNPATLVTNDASPNDASVRDDTSVDDASDAADSPDRGTSTNLVAEASSGAGGNDARSDAASDATSSMDVDATGDDASGDSGSACDFSGIWATKLTIGVNWVPQGIKSVLLASGTGTIEQWFESTRVQTGNTTTDTAKVCGIALPDFSGTNIVGGETYGVRFPSSLFDNNYIPTFEIQGTLSDSTSSASFTTTNTASLLGITLPDPTTTPWPTVVTTAVDSDQDGNPGVTINAATGGIYSYVPVDLSKTRANELYIVVRQVSSLSGAASGCSHISGTVSIPKIPPTPTGKYGIDSHIIGCELVGGGNCTSAQASFADGTQPVFSPSGPATFTSVRIAGTTTCASIRQLLP